VYRPTHFFPRKGHPTATQHMSQKLTRHERTTQSRTKRNHSCRDVGEPPIPRQVRSERYERVVSVPHRRVVLARLACVSEWCAAPRVLKVRGAHRSNRRDPPPWQRTCEHRRVGPNTAQSGKVGSSGARQWARTEVQRDKVPNETT
jgi:hypothetical protein